MHRFSSLINKLTNNTIIYFQETFFRMRQEKKYYYSVEIEFLQFSFRNCETSRIWHEHLEKRKMKFSAFIGELAAQRVPSDVWHWRRLMRDASPPLPALLFSRDHACLRFKPGELLINNAGFFQQRVPMLGQNAFFNFVIIKRSKQRSGDLFDWLIREGLDRLWRYETKFGQVWGKCIVHPHLW